MGHTFYIDLTFGFNRAYRRLQKNGSYRLLTDPQPTLDDHEFSSVYEIIQFQQVNKKITIDDEAFIINPFFSSMKNKNELLCSIYVARDYFPLIPAKEQMISILKFGNDTFCNSLILNIYGLFELRDFRTLRPYVADPTIAVRNESFGPNNNCVGHEAILDTIFINNTYKAMLELWLTYLRTGRGGYYSHGWTERSEAEILSGIEKLRELPVTRDGF